MPRRIIEVNGEPWEVEVSGRLTQYTKDEFGLVFSRGTGPNRERRVARYTPLDAKSRELSLGQLSDRLAAQRRRGDTDALLELVLAAEVADLVHVRDDIT